MNSSRATRWAFERVPLITQSDSPKGNPTFCSRHVPTRNSAERAIDEGVSVQGYLASAVTTPIHRRRFSRSCLRTCLARSRERSRPTWSCLLAFFVSLARNFLRPKCPFIDANRWKQARDASGRQMEPRVTSRTSSRGKFAAKLGISNPNPTSSGASAILGSSAIDFEKFPRSLTLDFPFA